MSLGSFDSVATVSLGSCGSVATASLGSFDSVATASLGSPTSVIASAAWQTRSINYSEIAQSYAKLHMPPHLRHCERSVANQKELTIVRRHSNQKRGTKI